MDKIIEDFIEAQDWNILAQNTENLDQEIEDLINAAIEIQNEKEEEI